MTPQEKYDSDRWFVMRKIKERELYNSSASSNEVRYYIEVTPFSKFEEHPPSAQISILRQLASEGMIEILHEENKTGYGAYFFFILRIIRPKFDELYLSYEKSIGYKKDEKTEPAESGTFWLKSEPTLTNIRTRTETPRRRLLRSRTPQKNILAVSDLRAPDFFF